MTKNQIEKRYGKQSSMQIGTKSVTVAKGTGDHFNLIRENKDGTFESTMSFGLTWGQEKLEEALLNGSYEITYIKGEKK